MCHGKHKDYDAVLFTLLQKGEYKPVADGRFKDLEPLIPDYVQEPGRKYVTYELLWNEYRKKFPEGYGSPECHSGVFLLWAVQMP